MSKIDKMILTREAALFYEEAFMPAIYEQWPPFLLGAANTKTGDRILDVGCGTGALAREAIRRVAPDGEVTGLDLSESMLSIARQNCPEATWQQGDASQLPFEDASFDVVASPFMLMFLPEPVQAVREMWRVLAVGGRLVISVWEGLHQNPVFASLTGIARRRISGEVGASLAQPFALGREGSLEDIYHQAGIEEARFDTEHGRVRFPSVDLFIRSEIKNWLLADEIDEDIIKLIIEDAREAFKDYIDVDGHFDCPLNARLAKATKQSVITTEEAPTRSVVIPRATGEPPEPSGT